MLFCVRLFNVDIRILWQHPICLVLILLQEILRKRQIRFEDVKERGELIALVEGSGGVM